MGRAHLTKQAGRTNGAAGAYDHVDFRVRDLKSVRAFYDSLMPALGFSKVHGDKTARTYAQASRHLPFLWLVQAVSSRPSLSRVAFAADSKNEVDRIARVVKRAGGHAIEGPHECRSYGLPYYAVFFEDPEGNRLEVCCRRSNARAKTQA